MCGIVGYAGTRPGKAIIFDGLRRLEYRGYDSAGLALMEKGGIETVHAVGNLDALAAALGDNHSDACVGLGHTRWATHGRPSDENAHPHDDCTHGVSIVLNGIIENYKELRAELGARGHTFTSETDAEVVAHLIEEHLGDGLAAAVRAIVPRLEGYFAFCALSVAEPDLVVGTRKEAPLGGRSRRRRDVHRLGAGRLSAAHAAHQRARRRRRGRAAGRRRRVQRPRRPAAGAAGRRGRLGRRRRREGRLRDVHAQGDPRAARGAARHDRRPPARRRHRRSERGRHRRRAVAPHTAHLHRRLRHQLPRRAHRELRHRAARARAGADRRRQRVPLPPAGARRRDAGHRHHAVGRDARHAGRHASGARGRSAGAGAHQHHGQPGDARRRLRHVHARRPRDRRGGDQDARRPGRRAAAARPAPGVGARRQPPRPSSSGSARRCASCPTSSRSCSPGRAPSSASPAAITTSASSSTSAAAWATASASRARSSSRRSATSPPRRTPPAR